MDLEIPERFNAAVYFVDRNLQAGRGDKIAIRHEGRSYTYRDIAGLVNRWGNVLRGLGVEAERRIALLCLDSPEFVAGFFGAIRVGVVPVPLNTLLRPADYEYLLNDSRARLLLVHRELWEPLTPLRDRCGFLRHVVVIGEATGGCLAYDDLMRQAGDECVPADTSRDDVAFWLYSSGSTGFPKGTVHLQHDMVCCARAMGQGVLGLTAEDVMAFARRHLAGYKVPREVTFHDDFPRDAAGKLIKRVLREPYWAGRATRV